MHTRETKPRKKETEKFTQSLLKLHLRNYRERPLHSTKPLPSFGGGRTGAGPGSPSCSRDPLPVRPNPEKDPECLTKKDAAKCFAPSIFAVLRTAKMTSARRLRPTHRSESPASPSGTRAFRCRAPGSPSVGGSSLPTASLRPPVPCFAPPRRPPLAGSGLRTAATRPHALRSHSGPACVSLPCSGLARPSSSHPTAWP